MSSGEKRAAPRFGRHWARIGFQGNDPATDLRDLGMLSVLQLLYLVQKQRRQIGRLFELSNSQSQVCDGVGYASPYIDPLPKQSFPLAITGVSLSRIVLQGLRNGSLVNFCNDRGCVFPVRALTDLLHPLT